MKAFTVEKLVSGWIIRKDHDIIGVASSFVRVAYGPSGRRKTYP